MIPDRWQLLKKRKVPSSRPNKLCKMKTTRCSKSSKLLTWTTAQRKRGVKCPNSFQQPTRSCLTVCPNWCKCRPVIQEGHETLQALVDNVCREVKRNSSTLKSFGMKLDDVERSLQLNRPLDDNSKKGKMPKAIPRVLSPLPLTTSSESEGDRESSPPTPPPKPKRRDPSPVIRGSKSNKSTPKSMSTNNNRDKSKGHKFIKYLEKQSCQQQEAQNSTQSTGFVRWKWWQRWKGWPVQWRWGFASNSERWRGLQAHRSTESSCSTLIEICTTWWYLFE